MRRDLAAVVTWLAMALLRRLPASTTASLGKTRSTRDVRGTSWTRFRYRFDASWLTMTAGRVWRTSPPFGDGNGAHHISRRIMGRVADESVGRLERLTLPLLIRGHSSIGIVESLRDHGGTHQMVLDATFRGGSGHTHV